MGAKSLSERDDWQMGAARTGKKGEDRFADELIPLLPSYYEVRIKPPKFPIYSDGKGIRLDHVITNHRTGKCLLIEKKTGNNGGNATQERAYKFATAGMQKALRRHIPNTVEKPVMFVFSGNTFSGPSYRCNGNLVHPQKYQEELAIVLEGENYAIIDREWSNIDEVAKQIMEIV